MPRYPPFTAGRADGAGNSPGIDIPLLPLLRAAGQQNHQHLPVAPEKYTRYPGPQLIRYSNTPSPTPFAFDRLPCSSRAIATVTFARAAGSSAANQASKGLRPSGAR